MESRNAPPDAFDLLVVGGGINGTGIARDAAGRGWSVLLVEQHDLAQHTSSSSTKLIHGGLRYLEHYSFGLVRKALQEREVLLDSAPHIMWPLRFVLPHDTHLRPAWLIRIGLFLYDHLARRHRLPGSSGIDLRHHPAGAPLDPRLTKGFVYSDGWVDDARLVALCARDAVEHGATVLTRTRCEQLAPVAGGWRATLLHGSGMTREVTARAVVNAAGPWAASFIASATPMRSRHGVRLVKGSHVIVRKLFDHDYAYIFQNPDGRIIFAIPYEQDFTLLGTTDVDYVGDPASVGIDGGEQRYLCEMASRYFRRPVTESEVVASYSGVRPLLADESDHASAVTRDYELELSRDPAPLLSVFGGKITTFRKLAEEAVDCLGPVLGGARPTWTASAPLPGGDLPLRDFERFERDLVVRYPWLPEALRRRYARAYGSRIALLLGSATAVDGLGEQVLPGLYAAEIAYLRREEWAVTADDILWRRSKLGLHLPADAATTLDAWLAAHPAGAARTG